MGRLRAGRRRIGDKQLVVMDLSVITVTHQSADYIEDLIVSVLTGALKVRCEHFIVDNASTDGTVERVEAHYAAYVTLIKNRENVGFSAANNQAYAQSRGRYVLFLNPDMKVESGSLDCLVEWMDGQDEKVAITTCKLVDPLGQLLIHRAPCRLPQFRRNILWLLSPIFCISREKWDHCEEPKEVEAVLGAFMLTRRAFLERLGFAFDPRYFLCFEDFDLCHEAKRIGYKVMYYPAVRCVDYNSRSFFQKPFLWIYAQVSRSMCVYFRKWGSWYMWICIALLTPVGYLVRRLKSSK